MGQFSSDFRGHLQSAPGQRAAGLDEVFFVDTVDLYGARHRAAFLFASDSWEPQLPVEELPSGVILNA